MIKKIKDKSKSSIFISIDMDDGWVINEKESFLKESYENIFRIFFTFKVKPTLFIVGKDVNKFRDQIEEAKTCGYEIGNHSYSHLYLDGLSEDKISKEITTSHEILSKIAPIYGFRAPGWSTNKKVDKILMEKNYLYDASRLKGSSYLILKLIHFMVFKSFSTVYGKSKNLISKNDIFNNGKLNLITTKTIFKMPFYNSFLKLIPIFVIKIILFLDHKYCAKKSVSYIFHARDFIGSDLKKSKRILDILLLFYNPITSIDFINKKNYD